MDWGGGRGSESSFNVRWEKRPPVSRVVLGALIRGRRQSSVLASLPIYCSETFVDAVTRMPGEAPGRCRGRRTVAALITALPAAPQQE